jgi:hypothetical protein
VIGLKYILVPVRVIVILSLLTVCIKVTMAPFSRLMPEKTAIARSSVDDDGIPSMFVQYESKGNNVFVECIVTGVTFREKDQLNRKVGKMIVWVDGKKSQEVSTAAFIVKDLAAGNHKVKLEVVDKNNKPYGISKEFMVNIPNN